MNSRLETKLNMYSAVISFCNQNSVTLATIPALQAAFTAFKDAVTQIDNFSHNQQFAVSGITKDKKQFRENLARLASAVALNVYAYADQIGNNELKSLTNFTMPDLLKYKDKDMPAVCRGIAATATAHLQQLAPYNITPATLTALNDALVAYEAYAARPRTAVTEISTNLKKLREFYKTADNILKSRMDKMIKPLKVVNEQFHDSYFGNRAILDAYTTPTQIKGVVTGADTKEPLRAVTITVVGSGKTTIANADGKYVLKPLTPGAYSIEAAKNGYITLTVKDINVKLGQITKVDLTLLRPNE